MQSENVDMKNKALILFCLLSFVLCPIKAQDLLPYPLDTINGEEVYRYEVERSIGLYRISVMFGISQNEIVRYNPQIREYGVRYGETLSIPTKRPVIQQTEPVVVSTTVTETVMQVVEAVKTKQEDSIVVYVPDGRVVELALLLPFESKQTKRSANADRMTEFYQGALLALHQLQNDSTIYRLRVYDTERSERRINALCDSTELDSVQAIIGPIYPIQIERMSEWCALHNVPLLLPFSDDIDLTMHPQVLQFNSTDTQEADTLCRWLQAQDSIRCVAVDVKEADLVGSMRTLRRQMKANGIPCAGMALRDILTDSAAYALDSTMENIIILHSDKYQHVRILLPHLIKLQEAGYRIRIVSQYSWYQEEIGLPQVFTSVFTSEAAREAYDTEWSLYFANAHASEAPRYDLLGYDLMQALVGWLNGRQQTNGLQSLIRWQQQENGGYQNACVEVKLKE
jgi:hypothetical protein